MISYYAIFLSTTKATHKFGGTAGFSEGFVGRQVTIICVFFMRTHFESCTGEMFLEICPGNRRNRVT